MGRRAALAALTLAAAFGPLPAWAIPAFASRYGVECHFCHEGFPKLNTIGQRFKERGFRMEKEDQFDFDKWLRSVPLVLRAEGFYFRTQPDGGDSFGSKSAFLKGISAGNLGPRVSYWIDAGLLITDNEDDHFEFTKIDNGWGRVEVVGKGRLYAKAGRFELDLPFTQARTPHVFSYEIYSANTGLETDDIGNYQEGVELGGSLPQDVRWSAAVVKGHNNERELDLNSEAGKFEGNLFLRVSKRVMRNRFGAFSYIGRNTIVFTRATSWRDDILRVGVDASVWMRRLNLYGVAMYGHNDNSIGSLSQPDGTHESLNVSGGFLQADYHLGDKFVFGLRGTSVRQPPTATARSNETFTTIVPGIQFWPMDHAKLSFEYRFANRHQPNIAGFQLDIVL
jgi:hypothetical protein